ncbi:MAG: hypothetical protein DHS20C21_20600 [Gemmatimonadota bacterium]|nr:MAG: hypothetical protein DHS20C21_20600 [Gemmatimonadota bacterium]
MSGQVDIWVGALLTLMIFSFLYRDNPLYKFAEHLFVGVSAAYWMVQGYWQQIVPNLLAKLMPAQFESVVPAAAGQSPDLVYLTPLILGILLLLRLVPSVAWLSRWSMAFIIGYTAGSNLTRYLVSDFILQIKKTLALPLVVLVDSSMPFHTLHSFMLSFSNIIIVVGIVCGLIYFFFSKEHTGLFGKASRAGIWVLMVAFGASFGYTVMARVSLLIGRLEYLLSDWFGVF